MRDEVVQRVRTIVKRRWYDAEVKVFGSFNTGLYLPRSDIDIVVFGTNCHLYSLERELISANVAAPGSFQALHKASVPIIKYVDKETKVKVDISINMESGLKSAEKVKEYLKQYPLLDKMILVVKQYFYQCNLNEVYYGGIGSYSITLLIISFFQHCPKSDLDDGNLGVLLTNFFEFYGRKFDYSTKGIRLDAGGSYFDKPLGLFDNALLIKDPADPTNIIKGAWDMSTIKRAFESAYISLSSTLNNNKGQQASILSPVASISDEVVQHRRWVEERWGHGAPIRTHQSSAMSSSYMTFHSSAAFDKNFTHKVPRIYHHPFNC